MSYSHVATWFETPLLTHYCARPARWWISVKKTSLSPLLVCIAMKVSINILFIMSQISNIVVSYSHMATWLKKNLLTATPLARWWISVKRPHCPHRIKGICHAALHCVKTHHSAVDQLFYA